MIKARQLLSLLGAKLGKLDDTVTSGLSKLTPGQSDALAATAMASPVVAYGLGKHRQHKAHEAVLPEFTRQTRSRDPLRKLRNMFILPPKGVVKINGVLDLVAYSKGIPNPYVRASFVQAALPIVTGNEANAFFMPPLPGTRKGAVVVGNSVAPSILKHEMGHAKDFQTASIPGKMYRFSSLSRTLNTPIAAVLGNALSPTGAAERRAWKLSGISKDDPLREKALETYNAAADTWSNPIRASVAGGALLNRGVGSRLLNRLSAL